MVTVGVAKLASGNNNTVAKANIDNAHFRKLTNCFMEPPKAGLAKEILSAVLLSPGGCYCRNQIRDRVSSRPVFGARHTGGKVWEIRSGSLTALRIIHQC